MADLEYSLADMFASFYPATPAGETAIRDLMAGNGGSNKVFAPHIHATLVALRRAGFTVRAIRKASESKISDAELLAELNA